MLDLVLQPVNMDLSQVLYLYLTGHIYIYMCIYKALSCILTLGAGGGKSTHVLQFGIFDF